jgi:hypothetical protein
LSHNSPIPPPPPPPPTLNPSLKNASELVSRKLRLQGSPDQQKQKPTIPPEFSKGAIYKLCLCLLFNQNIGFERYFP